MARPMMRARYAWGTVIVLLVAGGIYLAYRTLTTGAADEQRGLILASVFRDHVPGLRTPLQYPLSGANPKPRDPQDIPLISGKGGCEYSPHLLCQSLSVSSAIVTRPDVATALLRFLDEPCAALKVVKAPEKVSSIAEAEQHNKVRYLLVAREFFKCDPGDGENALLIINVVDDLDDAKIFPKRMRYRLSKIYP